MFHLSSVLFFFSWFIIFFSLSFSIIRINHSNNAIVKPPAKTAEAAQRELAETMKQVRDAQALIQAAIDPGESSGS